jgi:hypothetical protein
MDFKIFDLIEVYENNSWHYEIKNFGYFEKQVDSDLLHGFASTTIRLIKVFGADRETIIIRYHYYVDCKTLDYIRQHYEIY